MATVLLSLPIDTFVGSDERRVGRRSPVLSVHPASPVLLTKSGPLGAIDHSLAAPRFRWQPICGAATFANLKFENRLRTLRPRGVHVFRGKLLHASSNRSLYQT